MNVISINLELIDEDMDQPRYTFNESSIEELAESINEVGLLNPIKVIGQANGRYKIIFGNRRYKACKKLKLFEIPCILSENENESDIYLEQLTENIQRENFTPIEEAIAFQKSLDNINWKISTKLLSVKLGKPESYIKKKIDLLIFGSKVRKLIHAGKDILPNSLTEEQVLKLKNIDIEYRDQLALKVAQDQASVEDVDKIAKLFKDKNTSKDMKEKLLNLKCDDIKIIWWEAQTEKTRVIENNKLYSKGLEIANQNADRTQSENDQIIEDYIYRISPFQEKINQLNSRIPSFHPLPKDIFFSIDEMTLEQREEFYHSLIALTSSLEAHLEEWKGVKYIIEQKRSNKNNIKLIKQ